MTEKISKTNRIIIKNSFQRIKITEKNNKINFDIKFLGKFFIFSVDKKEFCDLISKFTDIKIKKSILNDYELKIRELTDKNNKLNSEISELKQAISEINSAYGIKQQ